MPTYCYSSQDGEVIEKFYPMGKHPEKITRNGVVYERDLGAESGNRRYAGDIWPMTSVNASVLPSQVKEAREAAMKAGVPTEFTRDGRPILKSRKHRRDYLKTRGMVDKDGGYGDS